MSVFGIGIQGVVLGISLIVVIGPQNAFVIRQGLLKSHILSVIIVCLACDIIVMGASVFGAAMVGRVLGTDSVWFLLLGLFGVGFLLYYAFKSLQSAHKALKSPESIGFALESSAKSPLDSALESKTPLPSAHRPESTSKSTCPESTRTQVILTTLALTLLNPNFYLDTFIIIGGVSATLSGGAYEHWAFFAGLICVSFVWYFGVGYGVRILLPLFKNPRAWAVLDGFTALVMCGVCYYLGAFLWEQFA